MGKGKWEREGEEKGEGKRERKREGKGKVEKRFIKGNYHENLTFWNK